MAKCFFVKVFVERVIFILLSGTLGRLTGWSTRVDYQNQYYNNIEGIPPKGKRVTFTHFCIAKIHYILCIPSFPLHGQPKGKEGKKLLQSWSPFGWQSSASRLHGLGTFFQVTMIVTLLFFRSFSLFSCKRLTTKKKANKKRRIISFHWYNTFMNFVVKKERFFF